MPSTEGWSACSRYSHRHALPLQRAIAWRWNSCLEQEDGEFTLWLMASLMARMVLMESSLRPPKVSATIWMNVTPTDRHVCRLAVSLRCVLTSSAWPGVKAASCIVLCWSGEITCTSKAADRPPCQVGSSRMSAGHDMESGMMLLASQVGPSAADWAAENRTSLIALCRVILSPFPPQPTWWSPNSSAGEWHTGHRWGELWS